MVSKLWGRNQWSNLDEVVFELGTEWVVEIEGSLLE
jgi:hypothetical protein